MHSYEMTTLMRPEFSTEGKEELSKILSSYDAKIFKEDDWGEKELPYPIHKLDRAFFSYKEFQLDPQKIVELNRDLKLNSKIMRCMIQRADKRR